ncbi:hypothetical protein EV363DRAFT_1155611 [Boletus edulis]|nr:hypothetical protein EV363DRAFT_1155611 [Boletus edulis]
MCNDSRPAVTTAQSPFDDPSADIILHTSDHVDFRIFRLILTLSSPFFQGMFSLPQPTADAPRSTTNNPNDTQVSQSQTTTNGPPSIDVPEDSQTLDTLLRFLYPNTHTPSFHGLVHVHNVALAASKYDMPIALDKIANKVEAQYVSTHPLHVYLIACRMGWEPVARAAAAYCLDPDRMPREELDEDTILRSSDAGVAYHRLQTYREACRRALETKLDDMDLFLDEESCESESDGDVHGGISGRCLSRWTAQYLANIKIALLKCPRKDALDNFDLVPLGDCTRCYIDKAHAIATARSQVATELKDALSNVRCNVYD